MGNLGKTKDVTWPSVLEREVLVLERAAIDGLAAGAVVVSEVTTLAHEARDHPVKDWALVTEAFLPGA